MNKVTRASEPLIEQTVQSQRSGFGFAFAKIYASNNQGRKVLLVPAAVTGAGFSNNRWNVGNDLYTNAVTFANAAIAANPGSTFKGILWLQGETDALSSMSYATYKAALSSTITGFRSSITGASSAPFVTGRMVYSWQSADAPTNAIRLAIVDNAAATSRAAIIDLTASSNASYVATDGMHYNAVGMRALGQLFYDAYTSIP